MQPSSTFTEASESPLTGDDLIATISTFGESPTFFGTSEELCRADGNMNSGSGREIISHWSSYSPQDLPHHSREASSTPSPVITHPCRSLRSTVRLAPIGRSQIIGATKGLFFGGTPPHVSLALALPCAVGGGKQ